MRVRIIVDGEDLGNVEVERENAVRHMSDQSQDLLRGVLSDAVAQVQDAYRLRPLDTVNVAGTPTPLNEAALAAKFRAEAERNERYGQQLA